MKHKTFLALSVFILMGSLVIAGAKEPVPPPTSTPAPEKVFKWRLQSSFPETDTDFVINTNGVLRLIEEGSRGRVQVEAFPVGVLVEPDSIIDAVAKGSIEAGVIIANMAADRVPSCLGSNLPYGVRDRDEAFVLHYLWGMVDIIREEYATQNIHLLAKTYCGHLVFESTFPVNTVADFKGKKIWAEPTLLWLRDFGAAPVEVPGFDMYMAMKLGTIDGLTWTLAELVGNNLREVVKYVVFPPLTTPHTDLLVNARAWKALGPDLQRQIQDHIDAHLYGLAAEYDRLGEEALAASKPYGVQTLTLPEAEVTKMRKASRPLWDEVAEMSPYAGRMIGMYKVFMQEKGIPW